MKHILSIVLLTIVTTQTVYQGLVYAYYLANKEYIVQHLCENKNKPDLKCNGKCHLQTMLKGSESTQLDQQSEKKAPIQQLLELKIPVLFLQQLTTFTNTSVRKNESITAHAPPLYWYQFRYQYQAIFKLLEPPQFSLSKMKLFKKSLKA